MDYSGEERREKTEEDVPAAGLNGMMLGNTPGTVLGATVPVPGDELQEDPRNLDEADTAYGANVTQTGRSPLPGGETDTSDGFAGEGGANPDANLPPEQR